MMENGPNKKPKKNSADDKATIGTTNPATADSGSRDRPRRLARTSPGMMLTNVIVIEGTISPAVDSDMYHVGGIRRITRGNPKQTAKARFVMSLENCGLLQFNAARAAAPGRASSVSIRNTSRRTPGPLSCSNV